MIISYSSFHVHHTETTLAIITSDSLMAKLRVTFQYFTSFPISHGLTAFLTYPLPHLTPYSVVHHYNHSLVKLFIFHMPVSLLLILANKMLVKPKSLLSMIANAQPTTTVGKHTSIYRVKKTQRSV